MLANGREIDDTFQQSELLYRAFGLDEVVGTRLMPERIKFYPNMSMYRSKYSEPLDGRYIDFPKFAKHGVAQMTVGDIPAPRQSEGGIEYSWKIEHKPLPEHYAHCELRTYKAGLYIDRTDPPSLIKKFVRSYLSDKFQIVANPEL